MCVEGLRERKDLDPKGVGVSFFKRENCTRGGRSGKRASGVKD